jgi:dipeptidase E
MRLLLISSSLVHGYGYLDHPEPEIRRILDGISTVAFVPFALRGPYTEKVRERMGQMGFGVTEVRSRKEIETAEAIFIGGGNSFRLLKRMYETELLEPIRERLRAGVPYIGSSAGTNVATPSICTTNDMPIVYPPTFDALGLVGFQINPHYLDPDPASKHMGETREQRIREFHEMNETPVLGIREGAYLRIENGAITLGGRKGARLFRRGQEPSEHQPGERLAALERGAASA